MPFVLSGLFIFLARVADMSMATFRILMLMRGRSLTASLIGFVESLLYIVALGEVLKRLDNPLNMVFFAAGFGVGNYVGSRIEERIALGYVNAQIISIECYDTLQTRLREAGFGVTTVEGCGKDGVHQILHVLLKRRDLPKLMRMISSEDQKAFVSIIDTRQIIGGFFPARKSK
ncbi:MAG: DUF2179 domain-containing protein [Dethiobacter sp.]|jgi:uncharacterized protein YebE (UPF0316 family)|nr:MAG: DUF2179 domain-containing protein [Dethiobacter sp.]